MPVAVPAVKGGWRAAECGLPAEPGLPAEHGRVIAPCPPAEHGRETGRLCAESGRVAASSVARTSAN